MNITINGDVYITQYGELLGINDTEIDVDLDNIPFFNDEDFDDEYEYCDSDCENCGLDEEEYSLDELIEDYVEILQDECLCEDCLKAILTEFLHDFISLAEDEL